MQPQQLIRLPEVRRLVGLSRTEIYRRMKRKEFPQSVSLGPATIAWSSAEVQQWIERRIAERNALHAKAVR